MKKIIKDLMGVKIVDNRVDLSEFVAIGNDRSKSINCKYMRVDDGIEIFDARNITRLSMVEILYIPKTLKEIESIAVFLDQRKLKSIIVHNDNERFLSYDGVLYDKINRELLFYPANKNDEVYTVPSNIISMENCYIASLSINTINIHKDVVRLPKHAPELCVIRNINIDRNNLYYKKIDDYIYSYDGTELYSSR